VQKEFDLIAANKSQYFFQPSVIASVGSASIKFQLSYVHSTNLTVKGLNQQNNNFAFGIVLKPSLH
jgi:hypothetical protein